MKIQAKMLETPSFTTRFLSRPAKNLTRLTRHIPHWAGEGMALGKEITIH